MRRPCVLGCPCGPGFRGGNFYLGFGLVRAPHGSRDDGGPAHPTLWAQVAPCGPLGSICSLPGRTDGERAARTENGPHGDSGHKKKEVMTYQ